MKVCHGPPDEAQLYEKSGRERTPISLYVCAMWSTNRSVLVYQPISMIYLIIIIISGVL